MSKRIWENLLTTKRSKIIMWEDRELTNKKSVPVLTQGCCSKHTVSSRHSTSKPDLFAKKGPIYTHTRSKQLVMPHHSKRTVTEQIARSQAAEELAAKHTK